MPRVLWIALGVACGVMLRRPSGEAWLWLAGGIALGIVCTGVARRERAKQKEEWWRWYAQELGTEENGTTSTMRRDKR